MEIRQQQPFHFALGYRKELNKGDLIVLVALGGGFTWGATLVKWEY